MAPRIGVLSFADVSNYGDKLFPLITRTELQKRLPQATFVLITPTGAPVDGEVFVAYEPGVVQSRFDALLLAGGEVIHTLHDMLRQVYHKSSLRTHTENPTDIVFDWPRAEAHYKAWLSVGVPPINSSESRQKLRDVLARLDCITVRGVLSGSNLENIAARAVATEVVPDLGWFASEHLAGYSQARQWIAQAANFESIEDPYIVFNTMPSCLISPGLPSYIADTLVAVQAETRIRVVLLPIMHCWDDWTSLKAIAEVSNGRLVLLPNDLAAAQIGCVLLNATAYVGSSLHGAITCLSAGIPAGVVYPLVETKFSELFASQMRLESLARDWGRLKDLVLMLLREDREPLRTQAELMRIRLGSLFDRLAQDIEAARARRASPSARAMVMERRTGGEEEEEGGSMANRDEKVAWQQLLRSTNATVDMLQRTLADVLGQLRARDQMLQPLNDRSDARQQAISELTQQLSAKDQTIQALAGQVRRQQQMADQLGADLRRSDAECRRQAAHIHDLQQQWEGALSDLHALQQTRSVRLSRAAHITVRHLVHRAGQLVRGRPRITGILDFPRDGSVAAGAVVVGGWAFSDAGEVTSVQALIADTKTVLGSVPYGLERADVLPAYPWRTQATCGFSGAFSLASIPAGHRTLVVRVTDARGNSHDFARSILVQPAAEEVPAIPAAPADPLRGRGTVAEEGDERALEALARARLRLFLSVRRRLTFPQVASPVVSVVIPTFNQAHYTLMALEGLLSSEGDTPYELVIVDNASQEETRSLLDRLDNVRVQLNERNLGFGAACNLGARLARGEYVCFLNSDTLPASGWLSALVKTMESYPRCGAVGGKLTHPSGRLQEAGSIIWQDGSTHGYGRGKDPLDSEYCYVREVDYCSAACLLVRKSLFLDIGGFDERYAPAYYEDADLCMAIREAGYKIVYQPEALVFHVEYGSSDGKQAIALQTRNQEQFLARWSERLPSHCPPTGSPYLAARDRRRGRRILVIDDRIPSPALGSGFPRARALLHALADLDYVVTLHPCDPSQDGRVAIELQQRGIEVLGSTPIEKTLQERAHFYDAVLVSRPHNATFINLIRASSPQTAILYDAEAVFAVRDAGQARVEAKPLPPDMAEARIREELAPMSSADVVLAVSEVERRLIERYQPRTPVIVWGHPVVAHPHPSDFHTRADLLFVGYLATAPNDDAVLHLLTEIFPTIQSELGCRVVVVGADPSDRVRAAAAQLGDSVVLTGYVEDLASIYSRCRVFVAPHRFSAGIPLKVIEAMAHGIPCVVSELLAEQLEVTDGVQILVAQDEHDFAEKVKRLYQEAGLWRQIRQNATHHVGSRCDMATMRETLANCVEGAIERRRGGGDGSRESQTPHVSGPSDARALLDSREDDDEGALPLRRQLVTTASGADVAFRPSSWPSSLETSTQTLVLSSEGRPMNPTDDNSLPLDERLERGELVLFERCPFPLPEGDDLQFLLSRELEQGAKTITLFPDTGVMGGHLGSPFDMARLKGILEEFSREATSWVARTLPRYQAAARFGPLRLRLAEERGRVFEPRLSGRVLHVDANSDMPAQGDSFLRIFVNINPDQEREWFTSLALGALLDHWGDTVREPGEGPASLALRFRLGIGRALGMSLPAETPYDRLMMRLHFFGKTDPYLQEAAPRTHWVFPPGSAWLVFSDLVSHAVVGGRFAIDQTYLVPPSAFRRRECSTRAVIDRFWRRQPAAPPEGSLGPRPA